MHAYKSIVLEREVKLEHGNFRNTARGTFSISKNGDVVLVYNEGDGIWNAGGRLAKIHNGEVTNFFKTSISLHMPVFDETGNIYFTTSGVIHAETQNGDPATLFKFNPGGELVWDYHMEGNVQDPPVFYQNSVFIYDILRSDRRGRLSRINKQTGDLIWKKDFEGPIWTEPLILPEQEAIILGLRYSRDLLRLTWMVM
jgi:outer membrane protein assembly factor BamB